MVPANDMPEIDIGMPVELAIDGFGERRFDGRRSSASIRRPRPARARSWSTSRIPNPDAVLRGGMFATGRIALAAGAPVPTLPGSRGAHRGGADLRLGDRGRQARAPNRRRRPARRSGGSDRGQDRAAAEHAGARRPLRQSEGGSPALSARRATNRKAVEARRALASTRRWRLVGRNTQTTGLPALSARSLRFGCATGAAKSRGEHAMWITRVSINNPVFATMVMVGIAVLGVFRLQAPARRADARCERCRSSDS